MQRYIINRIIAIGGVAFGVAILVFIMLRVIPGDAVSIMLSDEQLISDKQVAILRQQLGLDRPVSTQFIIWISSLLRGDMGQSFFTHKPISQEILKSLPVTLYLTFGALTISLTLGIPLGVVSAIHRNSFTDVMLRTASMIGLSMPNFWFAILFILLLSVYIPLFPSEGFVSPIQPLLSLRHLVLPTLSLGLPAAAVIMRMARSGMLEVMGQDYIRTARAKGLAEKEVIYRHALKNASINVLTVIGFQMGGLLGGSIVIETIFGWPGIGLMAYRAIGHRDYPAAQGVVLVTAFLYSLVTLLVDILYTYLDPRIRYE